MNCWEILGLDAEADERTIKRHYARLLKTTRPDEDPAAFQALREAYEQALRLAQWRAEAGAEAVETLVAVVETAVLTPAVRPLTESAVPVVEVDQRPHQLAELLTELRPSLLTERRLQAEAVGMAVEFERGVLRLCLKEEWESILRDAACAEYGWLEVREARGLTAAELLPLYERILQSHLLQLRALHNRSDPLELVDGLKLLLNQSWLQSYDGRALLESAVVSMLLEMPSWSCDTLDQVASVFAWHEGQREANCPDYQWRELLERWDAERFYARVLDNARRWELTAECRAARLVLAPMDRLQRRRFMSDFGDEERQHGTAIARAFTYRYPQLLGRLPGAPLDDHFWSDLACSGPSLKRALKLWIGFLIIYVCIQAQEGRRFDPAIIFFHLPVASAVLAIVFDKLLLLFDYTLRHDLKRFDYWLSGQLPSALHLHGVGLRPLRDGLVSYLAAMGAGCLAGFSFPGLFWQGLAVVPAVLGALLIVRRANVPGRLSLFLGGLWSRHRQYLHIAVFLGVALTVVTAMVVKSASETKPRYQTEADIARYCQEAKNHGDIRCVLRDAANSPPASER